MTGRFGPLSVVVAALLGQAASAGSDRVVAEWVIEQGGRVSLDDRRMPLGDVSQLPAGDFHLTAVDLMGTHIDPADLKRLSELARLKELFLPGYMWNTGAGSRTDANEELRQLAGLHSLLKLHLGLHFLTNINVQDKGIAHLAPLVQLQELRLAQTRIKGVTLAPLVNLRCLDANYTQFGDEGMESLRGMQHLTRLYLRDTLVTDAGLKALTGLKELEVLDLSGNRIGDAGVACLKELTGLRELSLLGATITDAGMDALAGMTRLRDLNLYRTGITNAGLQKLQAMKGLVALDLRYTRVTPAAVSALRRRLPECNVAFVGVPAREAAGSVREPKLAGEQALAEWVRLMGGKAQLSGGKLLAASLANTAVTDAQLAILARAQHIERLSLETTQIGDLGMRALASMNRLRELNLNQTTVTDAGVRVLRGLRKLSLHHTLVRRPELPAELEELELAGTAVQTGRCAAW